MPGLVGKRPLFFGHRHRCRHRQTPTGHRPIFGGIVVIYGVWRWQQNEGLSAIQDN